MCGFLLRVSTYQSEFQIQYILPLLRLIQFRGSNSEGVKYESGVWLGLYHLTILNLDVRLNQPLNCACGRYVIVFTGEITNYRALHVELVALGVLLHNTSDTEVMLDLFDFDGEAMLPMLRVMFSFLIWDRIAKPAFAASDLYEAKPLYWSQTTDEVLLTLQLWALLAKPVVSQASCVRRQAPYWLLGNVPEPPNWFQDIKALSSGQSVGAMLVARVRLSAVGIYPLLNCKKECLLPPVMRARLTRARVYSAVDL
jgi:asparagine synthase (glutamine-hydrolysing)